MTRYDSALLAAAFALSMISANAIAEGAQQMPVKKQAARPFVHPDHCHPGMGHGGYGMTDGYGMGGHGMGGFGHGMGMNMLGPRSAMIWSLDLTPDQRSKITKLIGKLQHDNWATMGTIMDDAGVLRDLYHADKRDSVAIDNTYQRIFDLKRKMIKSSLDTETEIENLLTPEQTKQFLDRLHQAPPPYPGR